LQVNTVNNMDTPFKRPVLLQTEVDGQIINPS
jgi:hypothetical protein